jgi:hypothetical protein
MYGSEEDLVIGCIDSYGWEQVKVWVNSLDSCGFEGKKVMIILNGDLETNTKLVEKGFHVVQVGKYEVGSDMIIHKSMFKPHVERFFHIWNVLRTFEESNAPRFVITTDVRDVVFQQNPSGYLNQKIWPGAIKDIVCASEGLKYEDEPWGNGNLFDTFGGFFHNIYKTETIYNVGVLGGRWRSMRDLSLMIFQLALNRLIPITDQAVFNFLIHQVPYDSVIRTTASREGWAAHLGTFLDPTKAELFDPKLLEGKPTFDGETLRTVDGYPYTFVHQYDRVPALKEFYERKFG